MLRKEGFKGQRACVPKDLKRTQLEVMTENVISALESKLSHTSLKTQAWGSIHVFRAMEDTSGVLCEHSFVFYVQSDIKIQHFYIWTWFWTDHPVPNRKHLYLAAHKTETYCPQWKAMRTHYYWHMLSEYAYHTLTMNHNTHSVNTSVIVQLHEAEIIIWKEVTKCMHVRTIPIHLFPISKATRLTEKVHWA